MYCRRASRSAVVSHADGDEHEFAGVATPAGPGVRRRAGPGLLRRQGSSSDADVPRGAGDPDQRQVRRTVDQSDSPGERRHRRPVDRRDVPADERRHRQGPGRRPAL